MDNADEYRVKALEFLRMAEGIAEPNFRQELINMAMSYVRLADLAEQNAGTDLVYESPAPGASRAVRH